MPPFPTLHAVALSEEVTGSKPLGVDIGDQPIVLWRDETGAVRVLEDRCPHRRAPLSLGCVLGDGRLQCGYHGWVFDGSGRVVAIPQLRSDANLPGIYRARRFAAWENEGFVWVAPGDDAAPATDGHETLQTLGHRGTAYSALDRDRLVALLLDGPHLIVTIPGVRITEYPLIDPHRVGDTITCTRACRRGGRFWPDRLTAELPLSLAMTIEPVSGLCRLSLRDAGDRELTRAILSLVPARRGTTAIRWRARSSRRGVPLVVTPAPDGAIVRAVLQDASLILREPLAEEIRA